MALFRRGPKGRHALGAAVTSIPSGPMREVVVPPTTPVVAAPEPAEPSWHQPAAEPHVMDSIAELLATGEAWSSEPSPPPTWREPVPVPAVEQPVLLAPFVEPVRRAPVVEPVTALAPMVGPVVLAPMVEPPLAVPQPPVPVVPARTALEAALADLLPQQPDGTVAVGPPMEAPVAPPPVAPLVKLGFRDGSSTSLDPSSSQSMALQELAQTLTRRD